MKALLATILFCAAINVYSQDKDAVLIENGVPYEKKKVSYFLDSLHNTNDYVLYFRNRTNWIATIHLYPAFILAKNQNNLSAYKCVFLSKPAMPFQCTRLDLPADSLYSIWSSYVNNNLFKIKTQKEFPRNCSYSVSDLGTYEFILLTKRKMKVLEYDAPEDYLRHCHDIPERKNVVNCASVITRIMK
jgi:hypothetical protein